MMTRSTSEFEQHTDHAGRRLQALALALFDGADEVHGLPGDARRLLRIASAFYDAGRQADPERPDRAGRDLALAAPLDALSSDDQAIVACVVAFQREKVRRTREPAFLRLSRDDRETALRLAAILQVAGALSESPATDLLDVQADAGQTILTIGGLHTGEEIAPPPLRDKLWRETFGQITIHADELHDLGERVRSVVETEAEDGWSAPVDILIPLARDGRLLLLSGGEPIAEGARRVLRRFFDKMLAREENVRAGEDAEDVHQMRVATRRLRASLQVAEALYAPKLVRRYRRGLRRIAESLGAVRDRDVFLNHITPYRDTLTDDTRAGMAPLVEAIEDQRARARARLLKDLDRRRYTAFKRDFATFLTSPGAGLAELPGIGAATRVRDFAGSTIWRRYEQWRAYEILLAQASDETLHQARIAGKRLRYTLEFFADALGPGVEQVLAPLAALQENLGALQDGVVAGEHIRALGIDRHAAVQSYLQAREVERASLLAELPRLWEKVASATYRRRLSELIVKL